MDPAISSDEIASSLGLKDKSYERMIRESRELEAFEGMETDDPSFPSHLEPFVEDWNLRCRLVSSRTLLVGTLLLG